MSIFYVYAWITPIEITVANITLPIDTVFYIGKGHKNRAWRQHTSKLDKRTNYLRNAVIDRIQNLGLTYNVSILEENLTEDQAFKEEIRLIQEHGRIIDKLGFLTNLTLGGEGCAGYKFTPEQKEHLSKLRKGKPNLHSKGISRPGIGGRKKGTKWSESERETQLKARQGNLNYKHSIERKEKDKILRSLRPKQVGTSTGKNWYHNGLTEAYFNELELPIGWIKGRLPKKQNGKKGLLWFTDGNINKQFRENCEPKGWYRGRILSK